MTKSSSCHLAKQAFLFVEDYHYKKGCSVLVSIIIIIWTVIY